MEKKFKIGDRVLCTYGRPDGKEGIIEGIVGMAYYVNFGEGFKGHSGSSYDIMDEHSNQIIPQHENGWIVPERVLEHTKESKVLEILRKWKSDRQLS